MPQPKGIFAGFTLNGSPGVKPEEISMKELVDMGMSKLDMYRAFTQKGKLYLPPIQMCNLPYFTGLLTGEKRAFTTKEIILA